MNSNNPNKQINELEMYAFFHNGNVDSRSEFKSLSVCVVAPNRFDFISL